MKNSHSPDEMLISTASCSSEPVTLPAEDVDLDVAVLAKALGNPIRVRILRMLLGRDTCYCGQIVDGVPLAQATVSQHLKVLKDAGLVQSHIEAPHACYCANRERIRELAALLDGLADTPTPVLESPA